MPKLKDVQQMVFNAGSDKATPPPLVDFNPDVAIAKKWLSEKNAGRYHGVPVTPEINVDEGGTAQGFSSGAVFHWTAGEAVELL